jgi:arginase family enzyme
MKHRVNLVIVTMFGTLAMCVSLGANAASINKHLVDKAPKEEPAPMPHIDPKNPKSLPIKQDKSTNIWRDERDEKRNPERSSGPIDIQRYDLQMEPVGIKTFFHLPIALNQQDLIDGQVDVAIFGAPTGALPHSAGNVWAPAEVRYNRDYGGYGDPKFPLSWVEYETLINPFAIINAVDYGDAGMNPYSNTQTLEEIRRITREIAETGAIPFAVGGDHSVPNGTFRGIVDVYGRKNVAFVHFDAHLDRGEGKFGVFYHSGTFMTLAVKDGLVNGNNVIQFGMSTPVFGEDDWDQVFKEGGKVYHIHEILRDGVDATFNKMYKDLEDIDLVYVSFDVDTFDMSYAPGTGSSSPTGMIPRELFPKLREFAATKTIVGFDIVEFNPFYDNKGQQTARLVRRIMLQFLTGIAMKKNGMDPGYIHPRIKGQP